MTSKAYYFDRITFEPDMMAGVSCTCNDDVSDAIIKNLASRGFSTEDILKFYPYLEQEDITRALGDASASPQ